MPSYKYICPNCDYENMYYWERGKAPRRTECPECTNDMDRIFEGTTLEMERDFSILPTETEQLRKNIEKTESRLDELEDKSVKRGVRKWRLELNGGKY